jgi:multidrug resistance efflux pump
VEEFDTKTRTYSSLSAAVKAAKAAIDLARLNLEFTDVRSPIDGRISRAYITEGNLISGGFGGSGATLLTTVVSQDPLYCYVDVDERAILKYLQLRREGKRVSARDSEIPFELASPMKPASLTPEWLISLITNLMQ